VSINKLPLKIKKQLCSRQAFTVVASCIMLSLCGMLSSLASAQQPINTYEAKPLRKKPTSVNYNMQRDPTRPPSVVVQQLAAQLAVNPEYQLTAIFKRNDQQYAVLNGDIVTTGDPVADMFISDITGDNLTMQRSPSSRNSTNSAFPNTLVLELQGTVNIKKQVTK
jgi:hypothetical protein